MQANSLIIVNKFIKRNQKMKSFLFSLQVSSDNEVVRSSRIFFRLKFKKKILFLSSSCRTQDHSSVYNILLHFVTTVPSTSEHKIQNRLRFSFSVGSDNMIKSGKTQENPPKKIIEIIHQNNTVQNYLIE